MEGDARGVGDVAEEDVLERCVSSLEYARQKRRAERLALAMDVGVVRAREIDALEGARARTQNVTFPFGETIIASPGGSSLTASGGTSKAACIAGRSLATTTCSSM